MAFPPAKGGNSKPLKVVDSATVTYGNGGIKTSLKVKAAGTKPTKTNEKTVNLF